ncbi:MAG: DUF4179 domain-containing protein [Eubacteriales bacterium]|nr:DUF4179 domain-containing protein [Eubacteriales bacterium]
MKHYMNEYKDALDNIQLSGEQQERLFRAAIHQADQHTRCRPSRRPALAGIVLVSILALTACGVAIKTLSELYAPYFGNSDSQSAVIEEYGTALEASDTDNGVTISAKAVLGDERNAWILYTISWDNSADIDLPDNIPQSPSDYSTNTDISFLIFNETRDTITTETGYSRDIMFTDPDPSDNEIEWMECYSFEGDIPFRSVSKTIDSLYWYSYDAYSYQLPWLYTDCFESPDDVHLAIEGHWELDFDASYESCALSVPLEDNATFTYNGRTFEITELTISPLSAYIEYTYTRTEDDEPIIEDEWGIHDSVIDSIGDIGRNFYITTDSGQTCHTNGVSLGGSQYFKKTDSYLFRDGGTFTEIIPPDEMKSITIGETTFPISYD